MIYQQLLDQAQRLHEDNRTRQAIVVLKDAIDLQPQHHAAYQLIGAFQHHLGKFKRMLPYYKKAQELNPDSSDIELTLLNHGMLENHKAEQKSEVIDHDECLRLFNEGCTQMQAGNYPEAKDCFHAMLSISSAYIGPLLNLAQIAYWQDDFNSAIAWARQAAEINPKSSLPWYNLGTYYNKLRDWDQAINVLGEAVSIETEEEDIWFNLGFAYFHAGRIEQALACLEECLDIQPDYHNPQYFVALCYAKRNDRANTLKALRRVLRLEPEWREHILKNTPDLEWLYSDKEFQQL